MGSPCAPPGCPPHAGTSCAHSLLSRPRCLYPALSPYRPHPFFMLSLLHLLGGVAQNPQGGLVFFVLSGQGPRYSSALGPWAAWPDLARLGDPSPCLLCRSPPLPLPARTPPALGPRPSGPRSPAALTRPQAGLCPGRPPHPH